MRDLFRAVGSMALVLVLGGCGQNNPMAPKPGNGAIMTTSEASGTSSAIVASTGSVKASSLVSSRGSVKGAAGEIPAFYDGRQITINDVEISENAAERVGSNPSHNQIYVTNDLDDPQDFDPVIDAIQGDGFNPLWEQIRIVFNQGVTPHQFTSDDDVLAAANGPNPTITLVDTHEVYRCAVVGSK